MSKEVSKYQKSPPLAVITNYGQLATAPSFGGLTLGENIERVEQALENFAPLLGTWNRTKSEWIFKHGNMKYMDPLGNLKQATAELGSKKAALDETKWRYLKNEAKLMILQEKLEKQLFLPTEEQSPGKIRLLEIKIMEMEEGMINGMRHIQGCMKDVMVLEDLRIQLMAQIGEFSEEDYERQEAYHHVCLCLNQCLRDVRGEGRVFKGNAEYLEWIGLNPTAVQKAMEECVAEEKRRAELDDFDGTFIIDFLRNMAHDLAPISSERAKKLGFTADEFFNQENVSRAKVSPDEVHVDAEVA